MLFYSYFIFVAFLSNRFPRLPWPYASKQASLAIDAHVMEYGEARGVDTGQQAADIVATG